MSSNSYIMRSLKCVVCDVTLVSRCYVLMVGKMIKSITQGYDSSFTIAENRAQYVMKVLTHKSRQKVLDQ